MFYLTSQIKKLIGCVSKDKSKLSLNNICIRNGKAIASDGHIIAEIDLDYLGDIGEREKDFIIPIELVKSFKMSTATHMATLALKDGKAIIKIPGKTFEISDYLIGENYPDTKKIYPTPEQKPVLKSVSKVNC